MYTEYPIHSYPFFLLCHKKRLYPLLFNIDQILNFTHSVFLLISFIHSLQSFTRKFVTLKTVVTLSLFAKFNRAFYTPLVYLPAAKASRAFVLFSQIMKTQSTVHSTRSNQFLFHFHKTILTKTNCRDSQTPELLLATQSNVQTKIKFLLVSPLPVLDSWLLQFFPENTCHVIPPKVFPDNLLDFPQSLHATEYLSDWSVRREQ